MKNQKGYTMILVVIIISVVMILGVTLSGATLNTRKQFTVTDAHSKATDLAEMGITHYQAVVNELIAQTESDANKTLLDIDFSQSAELLGSTLDRLTSIVNVNFQSDFFTKFNENYQNDLIDKKFAINNTGIIDNQNYYEVMPSTALPVKTADGSIKLDFESTGHSQGDSVKLKGTIYITELKKQNNLLDLNLLLSALTRVDQVIPSKKVKQNDNEKLDVSAEIQELTFDGNKASLSVDGDLIADKLTTNGSADTELLVSGNVFLPLTATLNGNGNANTLNVCVFGDIYLMNDKKTHIFWPNSSNSNYKINNQCEQTHWTINPEDGIKVDYK